ncbi:hypothetical protein OsI_15514 [Oryza sativa Indica Group]|uniref:Uncharacterized protein n=1 Tax=Oryza sativa subsp. indica TaxID=39946 RepID=A2XSB7_ORYSI|nr:hypothetical protein OsI_15514 [Oryza sativa Indica Group]
MEGRAGGHRFSSTDLLLCRHVIASGISRAATVLPESRGAAALRLHWEVADSPLCQEDAGREREEPILSHCAAEEPLTCRIWRGVGRQWHPDEEELKKPVVRGREGGERHHWRGKGMERHRRWGRGMERRRRWGRGMERRHQWGRGTSRWEEERRWWGERRGVAAGGQRRPVVRGGRGKMN